MNKYSNIIQSLNKKIQDIEKEKKFLELKLRRLRQDIDRYTNLSNAQIRKTSPYNISVERIREFCQMAGSFSQEEIIKKAYDPKSYEDLKYTALGLGYKPGWAYYEAKRLGFKVPRSSNSCSKRLLSKNVLRDLSKNKYSPEDASDLGFSSLEEYLFLMAND